MIKGNKINFVPIDSSSLKTILDLLNNPNNIEDFLVKPFILKTFKQIEEKYVNEKNNNVINYVATSNIGNFLGIITINITGKDKKATIEIVLDKELPNYKDKFKEVLDLTIKYCFNYLNIQKIKFIKNSLNKDLDKVLKELKFSLEVTSRQEVFYKGKYLDALNFGLIR